MIKDGKVIDTAELNESNSWKTTFKVDDDGDYKVNESEISGYDTEISGNANRGFVIKNSIIQSEQEQYVDFEFFNALTLIIINP